MQRSANISVELATESEFPPNFYKEPLQLMVVAHDSCVCVCSCACVRACKRE